ncbi:MAG: c-type cytochrome domain-containing protein, partial [Verrucomicrobiota bacterium]
MNLRLDTFSFLIAFALPAFASAEFEETIVPFLETHCFDCHDDLSMKGDLDLSRFFTEDDVMADRAIWASVYEKIESHQMPPPKRKSPPTDEERAALLSWIEEVAARPVLRDPYQRPRLLIGKRRSNPAASAKSPAPAVKSNPPNVHLRGCLLP